MASFSPSPHQWGLCPVRERWWSPMTALQVGRLGPSLEWKGLAVAGVWGLCAGLWGLGFREQEQPEKSSRQGPRSKSQKCHGCGELVMKEEDTGLKTTQSKPRPEPPEVMRTC